MKKFILTFMWKGHAKSTTIRAASVEEAMAYKGEQLPEGATLVSAREVTE